MGEYVDIRIKKLSVRYFKNYLEDKVVELFFNQQDLVILENVCEEPNDEDSTPYTKYMYKTSVKRAKERMDCMGYGLSNVEKIFEEKKYDAINYTDFLIHLHVSIEDFDEKAKERIREKVTFQKWKNSMKKIIGYELDNGNIYEEKNCETLDVTTECDKVIKYSLTALNSESYYGINTDIINEAYVFRLILECCDEEEEVCLDFSDLDYYDEDCIPKAIEAAGNAEKTIVLVEGTSDKDILEFAMRKIYPHLSDLFYFMDFDDGHGKKRDGGTSFIIKNLETFYFSKLKAKFIALFDNDATGYQSERKLFDMIQWPNNFRIMCYPEIKDFKKYPTLVPNGTIVPDDINKKACSIELYLPDRIIKDDNNEYYPIEWESRIPIKEEDGVIVYKYQGVIMNKDEIKREFHKLRNAINNNEVVFDLSEWKRMKDLLDSFVFAFK